MAHKPTAVHPDTKNEIGTLGERGSSALPKDFYSDQDRLVPVTDAEKASTVTPAGENSLEGATAKK